MEHYTYATRGVCSRTITFDIEDDIVKNVSFINGCSGNAQGIGKLVEGMHTDEIIKKLEGINCSGRGTSCPDQLTKALKGIKQK